jgi:hypothetical protein
LFIQPQHNRAAAVNSLPVNSILPHLPRQQSSKFDQEINVSLHGRKRTRKRRENEEMPPFAKRLMDRKEERDGKKRDLLISSTPRRTS